MYEGYLIERQVTFRVANSTTGGINWNLKVEIGKFSLNQKYMYKCLSKVIFRVFFANRNVSK